MASQCQLEAQRAAIGACTSCIDLLSAAHGVQKVMEPLAQAAGIPICSVSFRDMCKERDCHSEERHACTYANVCMDTAAC